MHSKKNRYKLTHFVDSEKLFWAPQTNEMKFLNKIEYYEDQTLKTTCTHIIFILCQEKKLILILV
jgi:hypothetical protein